MANSDSLADLLVGFFEYFDKFNFESVISTRLGRAVVVSSTELLQPNHSSFTEKSIRIEEPFDGTNTARACWKVDSFAKVKYAIRRSLKILRRCEEVGANIERIIDDEMEVDRDEFNVSSFPFSLQTGYNFFEHFFLDEMHFRQIKNRCRSLLS